MSFNNKMHPRNIFKKNKPDFKQLAKKYDRFRDVVTEDAKGKIHLNFKEPTCLRALTWVLLKEHFNLEVDVPLSRLVPTVPLRLNYLLWIEDIFADNSDRLRGIDIGTGAVCIYPLLGARMKQWRLIASEVDSLNHQHATLNVSKNQLESLIKVVKVEQESTIADMLSEENINFLNENNLYEKHLNITNISNNKSNNADESADTDGKSAEADFCMCNPPFFENSGQAWGVCNSRSSERPEAKSVSTASEVESVCVGGEVEFVRRNILQPSVLLGTRVRVYTTMLGKKSSQKAIIKLLKQLKVPSISSTEFGQGHTMRWGVAWTFLSGFSFKTAESNKVQGKTHRPLKVATALPHQQLASVLQKFLDDLQLQYTKSEDTWHVTAFLDTWSHQRRKRRRKMMMDGRSEEKEEVEKKRKLSEERRSLINKNGGIEEGDEECVSRGVGDCSKESAGEESLQNVQEKIKEMEEHKEAIVEFQVKMSADSVLEFQYIAGSSVDTMHQICQNFKNRNALAAVSTV